MTCSKARFVFRPCVENLESRLQPGSVIVGQGYGWSLIDTLSILDPSSLDSHQLILQASSESSKPAVASTTADVHHDHQDVAVARVIASRGATSSLLTKAPVDTVAADLTDDDLGQLSIGGQRNKVSLPATQNALAHQPISTPAAARFVESPIGVATPAQAAANTTGGAVGGQPGLSLSRAGVTRTAAERDQPTPAPAPQPIPVASSTGIAPLLRPVPNLHVTVTHYAAGGVHALASQPVWATYLGGAGDDRLQGIALSHVQGAAQPVVVTGFTQNAGDPTEYDGLLDTVSTDGTSATVMTFGPTGTGTRTEGHSVDVDPAGNMYVIGQTGKTSDPTTNSDLIARINPAGKQDWAVSFTSSGSTGVGNGLKLDAAGTNLYVTGGIDGNLLMAKLTNLGSAMPTAVYADLVTLAAGSSQGTAIAPDSVGDADLAFTLTTGTDNQAAVGQLSPDGVTLQTGAFTGAGPKSGSFGVAVDASDNFYLTGGLKSANTPFEVLLSVKFDVNFTQQYGFTWRFNDAGTGNQVDAIGHDIKVDDAGNAFMAVVRDGGTIASGGTGTFMKLFEVNPNGDTSLDNQQLARGTGDDENRALALDTTNGVLYMAGFTSSPDFGKSLNLTASSFQPTYGGDPFDGILVQDQLT